MELSASQLDDLITWLHQDLDHSIENAEPEVIENYTLMFNVLNLVKENMMSLQEPMQIFGYESDESNDVSCMVSNVLDINLEEVKRNSSQAFQIGDWFLSKVEFGHRFTIHGPFDSMEAAMEFGRIQFGVTIYRGSF